MRAGLLFPAMALLAACTRTPDKPPPDTAGDSDSGPTVDTDSGGDTDSDEETGKDSGGESAVERDVDGDGHDDVTQGGDDCNDSDASVYPGADDTCEDGLDADCDGADPACRVVGELADRADAVLIGEDEADYAGQFLTKGDVDGDGLDDLIVSAWHHSGSAAQTGAVYVVPSPVAGEVHLGTVATRIDGVEEDERLGETALGDVDGDGVADLLVGAILHDQAFLLPGPLTGAMTTASASLTFDSEDDDISTNLGEFALSDLDGDGADEIVIAQDGGRTQYVHLFRGDTEGIQYWNDLYLGAYASIRVSRSDVGLGRPLEHADMDGDGLDDLLLGDWGAAQPSVLVVLSPVEGDMDAADADAVWQVPDFGIASSVGSGDLDADGQNELVVGWYGGESSAGVIYIADGALRGTNSLTDSLGTLRGENPGDFAGYTLKVGDFDAEAGDELAVGAPWYAGDTGYQGAVYIWHGLPSWGTSLADAGQRWTGAHGESAGHSLAQGDFDGDRLSDLLVGAAGYYSGGPGRSYLLLSL